MNIRLRIENNRLIEEETNNPPSAEGPYIAATFLETPGASVVIRDIVATIQIVRYLLSERGVAVNQREV